MRNGIVGFVGILAEPEIGILNPLDMGIGFSRRVEVEIGVNMPGEEIAGITSEEVEVGITGRFQESGGNVLGYPADVRIEKFRDDVGLASVDQIDLTVGLSAGLEALTHEHPGWNLVGATGGGKYQGKTAAITAEPLAGGGGVPCGHRRIGVTTVGLKVREYARAIGRRRLVFRAVQAGRIEPVTKGVGVPINRFGGSEEFSRRRWHDGAFGGRGGAVNELARLEPTDDLDVPMDLAVVAARMGKRGGQEAMGRDRVIGLDFALEVGTEMFDLLRARVRRDGKIKHSA